MEKTVSKSIFGKSIDQRCLGYTTFQKFLVWIGVIADAEQDKQCDRIDIELRKSEGRFYEYDVL